MELMEKQGYKQTEVGLIPEDWNVLTINDVATVIGGGTPSTVVSEYWNGNINWFTPTEIGKNKYSYQSKRKITSLGLSNSSAQILPIGTILMSTRASIGDLSILLTEATTNQGFQSLIAKNDFYNEFLYYLVQNNKSKLIKNSSGSTFLEISPNKVKSIEIPIPPTLEEQKAIATALSDVDELISNLDKLITKKKAIKQGAMQQLLTPPHKGGKRLEGFTGEWEEKKLGEITNIKTGSRNNQDKVEDGIYPFFVRSQTIEKINSYSFDCEAILVPGEGGIGSIFHYINGKFEVHQRVYKISDFIENVVGKYIYLQMRHSFGKHAMTNSVKATVDSLRLPTFQEFIVPIPTSKEEQIAIAGILTNIEAEIEQLENKKAKYQNIKQGMMQELLTGKTRLV